ncbi:hypothetical protein ACHAXR_004959 [Thalassiosira sp. AJA248-18]
MVQRAASSSNDDEEDDEQQQQQQGGGVRAQIRQSVTKASKKVQNLVYKSPNYLSKAGKPIAGVLTDAAVNAAELAAEEVRVAALDVLQRGSPQQQQQQSTSPMMSLENQARIEAEAQVTMDAILLAKTSVADAFDAAESVLKAAENEIQRARNELENAKRDATLGLAVAEKAAAEAAVNARRGTESAVREVALRENTGEEEKTEVGVVVGESGGDTSDDGDGIVAGMIVKDGMIVAENEARVSEEVQSSSTGDMTDFDVSGLTYEDIDYTLTDMAPPFINEDECLVPGEPVVRVEKAPQNSRRIFAGIDIPVSVDDVWALLTDYPNLQKVVPNLVVNEVLKLYPGGGEVPDVVDATLSDAAQCQTLANQMKGAVLKQVGGAKVVGINFSARTTLEVREWPGGMPDFAHIEDEIYDGKSRSARVRESRKRELMRYVFPRPFALSTLPHKDISMQSVEEDDGEFRMYQGVWRMQPLAGCAPPGGSAMRLTYAVEVSPRPYLPVALVEGRIAQDLCANLKAIRDMFENGEA